jgi:hypothetical protein
MATRTKAQFEALYGTSGTTFPDNIIGSISEGDLRDFGQDIADSVFSSNVLSTKVTISTAEILAMNTTPKQLIAAQGAGTFVEVLSIVFYLDYNSAAYATNTDLNYQYGSPSSVTGAFVGAVTINSTADYIQVRKLDLDTNSANLINKPFLLNVATGNPTAGNSPLYVYLTYRVITL